ncbi:DUF1269 domain-containing protein [Leifsonia sp. McL0607]|uniref:DUF1269 domain-containing protein n=1 Tax=Leifsonia sp. McL0607 TaxID=3415672 RepID=UPI003CEF438D
MTISNNQPRSRQLLAASFGAPDLASRAAMAVSGAYPEKIGNTAVLRVLPDGKPKFTESKDWGAGRGSLLGGAIGLIGGPIGVLAGAGIGALASKLRDAGFPDDQLKQLGESLAPNESAVVFEIASDAIEGATALLTPLGAKRIVTEAIDSRVADLFATLPAPEAEIEAAGEPV